MKKEKTDWYLPLVYLSLMGGVPFLIMLIKCGFSDRPGHCSSNLVVSFFGATAYYFAMCFSGWAGIWVGRKYHSTWVGWAVLILTFSATASFLLFSGIPFPSSEELDWV